MEGYSNFEGESQGVGQNMEGIPIFGEESPTGACYMEGDSLGFEEGSKAMNLRHKSWKVRAMMIFYTEVSNSQAQLFLYILIW